ncbi:MAG: cell division protein FtsA [Rectinemataceae bacterium]
MADNLVVGLDIGTASTRAVVGEFNDEGVLEIVGVGVAPSTGLRRGIVLNIEATLASVAAAVEAAELMSGREIKSCVLGISGANVESLNSRGVVAVTGKGREITRDDVARVLDAAKAVVIPMDREVVHVIPQSYIVDDQHGVRDPLDMIGVRLEAEVHIVTGAVTTTQNLLKCVNRAGFKVERFALGSLGAARAALTTDEKELGCLLMDMGGGTTDLMVFSEGSPVFTSAVPAGGLQVTNDISIMLSVPMEAAERIKRESASCWPGGIDPEESIVVPGIGGRAPAEVPRRKLCSIVQPRMEEMLRMARDKVEKMGYWKLIKAGVVLTGGAALMPGAAELAQSIFGLPVRVGMPPAVGGLESEYRNPQYATAVGLVLLQADAIQPEVRPSSGGRGTKSDRGKSAVFGRLVDWIKNGFF